MHRDEVLAACLGPANRLTRGASEPRKDDVLDREPLAAEAAADVRRHDPHLLGLQPEEQAEHHLVGVRRLRRQPDRQAAVVAERRERRPRLQRAGGEPLGDDLATDDHLAAVEQLAGSGASGGCRRQTLLPIRFEQQDLVAQRALDVRHHRQRLVLDVDELGRVRRAGPRRCEHDGDDVAGEPHLLGGEERTEHPLVDPDERRRGVDGETDVRRP